MLQRRAGHQPGERQRALLASTGVSHPKDLEVPAWLHPVHIARGPCTYSVVTTCPVGRLSLHVYIPACASLIVVHMIATQVLMMFAVSFGQALVRLDLDIIAEDTMKRAMRLEKGDADMQRVLDQIQLRLKRNSRKPNT